MIPAKYIFFAALIGYTWAETDLTTTAADVETTTVAGAQELENKTLTGFSLMCPTNGGPNAFNKVWESLNMFGKNVSRDLKLDNVYKEVKDARSNGTVMAMSQKFCREWKPVLKLNLQNVAKNIKSCFPEQDKRRIDDLTNAIGQFYDFVCSKNGEKITSFIVTEGDHCIETKSQLLGKCMMNHSLIAQFYKFNLSADLEMIQFDEHTCNKTIPELQICFVSALNTCPNATTANLVDSMFRFLLNETPCKAYIVPAEQPQLPRTGSSAVNTVSSALAVAAALILTVASTLN